ncbi:phosphatase PAP2 family protein [Bacillus timonensis]|nr:phosphatase PAP2 family protein [Bacillus timonensis]
MEVNYQLEEKKTLNRTMFLFGSFSLVSLLIIGFVLQQLFTKGKVPGDVLIANWAESISTPLVTTFFTIFTEIGSKYGIGGLFLLSLLLLGWKFRNYSAMVAVSVCVLGGDQLNKWFKQLFARERPMIEESIYAEGFSFPSGHAMVGLAFYGFVAYLIMSGLKSGKSKMICGVAFSILIFFVGISRIILNAHYPSDVFAGFAFGFVYLSLCILLYHGLCRVRFFKQT